MPRKRKIRKTLTEEGFHVAERGSSGKTHYTNGGEFKKTYDLSNWKWITATLGDYEFLVSLQAFDQDISSKNHHVLMDRIGVCKFSKDCKRPDYYNAMTVTDLELPLSENDLKNLVDFMKNMVVYQK